MEGSDALWPCREVVQARCAMKSPGLVRPGRPVFAAICSWPGRTLFALRCHTDARKGVLGMDADVGVAVGEQGLERGGRVLGGGADVGQDHAGGPAQLVARVLEAG